ncbi:hypothetical protein Nepgr_001148 [Nepenthes gracilis]|uniref:X8 domain-containing protein n=1 Tax=Nepenthes gracilis TaxID=150966 RepID=A0AAD3P3Y8_NEPGR|nr:hypothetical protein Nepgr_001148 [Nepenthes gracilis]
MQHLKFLVAINARKPHKGSIIKSTKKMQINIMEDDGDASPLTELDSSSSTNTLPYVSSPFTLPPYDSLPPVPLPDNSPPYCIYPPPISPPPPPPTTMQSQPPGPIVSVPSPPELPPTPNPPQSFPSPPFTIPSPPGTVPSPPYTYEPSPPEYIPSPPTGITPSPPTGFAPSPPVFQPPVVFPSPAVPPPSPPTVGALWCVAKPSVPLPIIQEAMDYACGSGADCSFIQPDQACFEPNTLLAHASYAFNSYWQRTKVAGGTCDFGGVAILVTVDPSYRGCHFVYS